MDEIVPTSLDKAGLWEEVETASSAGYGPFRRSATAPLHRARHRGESGVILMDEPCSALDPIATAKVEELIDELRKNYTMPS